MVKINNRAVAAAMVVAISLLLIVTMEAEARLSGVGFLKAAKPKTVSCESVFGVRSGDTCFDIAERFKVTTNLFMDINPNLKCNKLFVGQWVCIAGTVQI